ncbi:type 1 glutamine amidotransferase [Pseudoprimorskyibacter insulae]|uniref:GMP synthase [glutamine-hydrolyzing] n=1 Tax=Pseudoprimorskyibacter insulae TaxID=1695997 RepID=A0A2R8AYF3_9RHOB|nr:type 1 glutamine amidotransferase [Pseudoprimorskyibacter insulae]SPF81038.1 GMP synthase [glutamine-hydrolyzing] [Pseudoprimorskyibacter insulae]
MKIGILQTGLVPSELAQQLGEYPDMFARLLDGRGFDFTTYAVVNGEFPDGPEAQDGWLITGSRHGVYEDHAWLPPLEALIRDIYTAGKPLIGVCFGHQIIAQALGGDVRKFDGGWSIGATDYAFGDETRRLNAWHQDQVVTPPEGAETVAKTDFCAHAALLYPGHAYTVQPHPEFGHDVVKGLIDLRAPGVVPQPLIDTANDRIETPLATQRLADEFETFFKTGTLA